MSTPAMPVNTHTHVFQGPKLVFHHELGFPDRPSQSATPRAAMGRSKRVALAVWEDPDDATDWALVICNHRPILLERASQTRDGAAVGAFWTPSHTLLENVFMDASTRTLLGSIVSHKKAHPGDGSPLGEVARALLLTPACSATPDMA